MIVGFAVLHAKLSQLKSLMLLALSVLFMVAVMRKSLQLSDLVALLFAMFASCSRQDISAYQVALAIRQILILLLLFSLYNHLMLGAALFGRSPLNTRSMCAEAAYVLVDAFAILVCWRSYQLIQFSASILQEMPVVEEVTTG